jgi:hypothetical protein
MYRMPEGGFMNLRPLSIVSILVTAPLLAAIQTFPGVTVLNHPGGGTIAYAVMPAQHTAQGAINRVMQYVAARFGATPMVSHVLKSKDGNSLAVTFTVKATTESPGDVTGLALVTVTAAGPGKGAVLSDQSARFGTTVGDMLQQMQQVAQGASTTTAMASSAAAGPAPASTPSTATAAPTSAALASASKAAASPIGPLRATAFPDGSGTVGLPDGWKIVGAHAGEVIAQGPTPALLHFNFQVPAYDPSRISASSRIQIVKGSHAIPYDADIASKLNLVTTQNAQAQHKAPPTVKLLATRQVAADNYLLMHDVTPSDGSVPFRAWTQIFVSAISPAGTYSLTMYQVLLPQNLSNDQGNAAVKALFGSYKADVQRAMSEIAGENAQNQAITNSYIANSRRAADASQRSFAADDYALLGNTVVRDRDFSEHGLVSDNLADALTQADPNRFQEVPPSQYIKGVDY